MNMRFALYLGVRYDKEKEQQAQWIAKVKELERIEEVKKKAEGKSELTSNMLHTFCTDTTVISLIWSVFIQVCLSPEDRFLVKNDETCFYFHCPNCVTNDDCYCQSFFADVTCHRNVADKC